MVNPRDIAGNTEEEEEEEEEDTNDLYELQQTKVKMNNRLFRDKWFWL